MPPQLRATTNDPITISRNGAATTWPKKNRDEKERNVGFINLQHSLSTNIWYKRHELVHIDWWKLDLSSYSTLVSKEKILT